MPSELSLREFVASTITDLIDAIHDAQKHAFKFNGDRDYLSGAVVNPSHFEDGKAKDQTLRSAARFVAQIEFDVGLTATTGDGSSRGIGVAFGALGLGAKSNERSENQQMTRMRFSIPVIFPAQLNADGYARKNP